MTRPQRLSVMPRQPSAHSVAGSEGLASCPPSLVVRCSPVADSACMLTQQKANHLAFAVLLVFCNAGMAQRSSDKFWSHYEEHRTAVPQCKDGRSGLSSASEIDRLRHGFDKQRGWGKRGSWLAGVGGVRKGGERTGQSDLRTPPTISKVQPGDSVSLA